MKMAAAPSFPPFFPPVFSTVGGKGEERQCLCSEKADLYCGKSKNAQICLLYHKFVNGMTVSRISVFHDQYAFFQELMSSLCFLIALTRAHASENYVYGVENI